MTTITASTTLGVVLTSPLYTNPIVVNPGITVSGPSEGVFAVTGPWAIDNYGSIAGMGTSGASNFPAE